MCRRAASTRTAVSADPARVPAALRPRLAQVTLNLGTTARFDPAVRGTSSAFVRDPAALGAVALVKQHGFDVRPDAKIVFATRQRSAPLAANAGRDEAFAPAASNESWAVDFQPAAVGFRSPGVKGLLDLSNASSGTAGVCSLSSAYETVRRVGGWVGQCGCDRREGTLCHQYVWGGRRPGAC